NTNCSSSYEGSDGRKMPRAELAVFAVVNGPYRNLDDAKTPRGELPEDVVRISEARPEIREIEQPDRTAGDRREAALRIANRLTDRERRHGRKGAAVDLSGERHPSGVVRSGESISLCVVRLASNDGQRDRGEIAGMHLSIAGHHA